jgi:RNA polymerase sigma factor (sigma-70 family)
VNVDRPGTMARQLRALLEVGAVTGLTDEQLLELFAARAGESAELAFAALVERHGPMVYRVCSRLLGGYQDADDAFQATFLILARRAGAIRRRESVGPWLFGVALRVATCDRAARSKRRLREQRFAQRKLAEPERRFTGVEDSSELAREILEEVGLLPEHYRSAVILCDLEGLAHEEAARRLGCPVGTIKSRQARGRERLRARLVRRGLAPSVALAASKSVQGAGLAAPLATLSESTARLAMASGAARSLSTGMVPVAVQALVEGALKTMFLAKLKSIGIAAILAVGVLATGAAVYAYRDHGPIRVAAQNVAPVKQERAAVGEPEAGLLAVTGIITMPDGSPAAGATLESTTETDHRSNITHADALGRFVLRGMFGNGSRLHARSTDGSHQAVLMVSSVAARTTFGSPLTLRLAPSITRELTVLSEGRPVARAHVVASGSDFKARGVTGGDGKVQLRLPVDGVVTELVAWHPALGVNGKRDRAARISLDDCRLSLLPQAPHKIHVVGVDGKAVVGLELAVSVQTEDSDWIVAREIEATHVRTDAEGIAVVPWTPRDKLKYVDVEPVGSDWKVDETERNQISDGLTTIHVRREKAVQGRLIMPEGADPDGILVTGFGFGPKNNGDIPYARARRDGTFTLRVPSEHAYVLGISDLQWASDPWSGVILGRDDWKPAEITMKVYPATAVKARVTRGPRHKPVVDAWVEVSSRGNVEWVDAGGEKRSASSGASSWLKTDADGVARAGLGRGKHQLRVSSGLWDEERDFRVTSDKPVEIEFHRPWIGERRISGRLMLGGSRFEPSRTLVARAWTPRSQRLPLEFEPEVHPDGSFEVVFDAEALSLYFLDDENRRAGFARLGLTETTADVNMETMAIFYGGTLLDENDRPMADRTLQLYVQTSRYEAVASRQTDRMGQFQFANVPANVPLQLCLGRGESRSDYFLFDNVRMFQPGEVRKDHLVKPQPARSSPVARPSTPLAELVGNACRNARSSGMHVLVVLQGDHSQGVTTAVDQLLDDDRTKSVLSYLTLRVETEQLKTDAAILAENGWPVPGPGEVVLVAMNGDRKRIAVQRVATTDTTAAAVGIGQEFLKRNRPPARDALRLLTDARSEATVSGRRVWIVHGGPRCGPCFRLAR